MTKRESLYFKDDRSDKVYTVVMEPSKTSPGLYIVRAEYGRRGGPMSDASKSNGPVTEKDAFVLYTKTLNEKRAKGYKPGAAAVPLVAGTEAAIESAVLDELDKSLSEFRVPQLLNEITESELPQFMNSDDWWMQPKKDGIRFQLHHNGGGSIYGFSRTGLKRTMLPEPVILAAMRSAHAKYVLDGELVGEDYFVFDVLELNGSDQRRKPYSHRYGMLEGFRHHWKGKGIQIVSNARKTFEKEAMFRDIKALRGEGLVFKRHAAAYTAGRPNSGGDQRKFKFVATGSFIVARPHPGGKSSIDLRLIDGTEVGSVTIPPNKKMPPVGAIVEVRYLYFLDALVQAVYLGERKDIGASECTAHQLKRKQTADAAETEGPQVTKQSADALPVMELFATTKAAAERLAKKQKGMISIKETVRSGEGWVCRLYVQDPPFQPVAGSGVRTPSRWPWELGQIEWLKYTVLELQKQGLCDSGELNRLQKDTAIERHKTFLFRAVEKGFQIPEFVLADYPDVAKTARKADPVAEPVMTGKPHAVDYIPPMARARAETMNRGERPANWDSMTAGKKAAWTRQARQGQNAAAQAEKTAPQAPLAAPQRNSAPLPAPQQPPGVADRLAARQAIAPKQGKPRISAEDQPSLFPAA